MLITTPTHPVIPNILDTPKEKKEIWVGKLEKTLETSL